MNRESDNPAVSFDELTTLNVRAALRGDTARLAWVIERFSPLLLSQAAHRLSPALRRLIDPEDLVQETWSVALNRLEDLTARDERFTPVLVRFLSQTLLNLFNARARKELRRMAPSSHGDAQEEDEARPDPLDETMSLTQKIVQREARSELHDAIQCLEPSDREVIVMRLIEGQSVTDVAALLSLSPTAVTSRLHRAMKRLRDRIGPSILEELL